MEVAYCPSTPCTFVRGVIPAPELARRWLVLMRVQRRIASCSKGQRPKTCKAFANFTVAARRVQTYTVPPGALLQHLENVSESVVREIEAQPRPIIMGDEMEEELPIKDLQRVAAGWRRLQQHSAGRMNTAEQARWIQAAANVEVKYPAGDILQALNELALLDFDNGMDRIAYTDACMREGPLPSVLTGNHVRIPLQAWWMLKPHVDIIRHRIRLPVGCAGTCFGTRGLDLKSRRNPKWHTARHRTRGQSDRASGCHARSRPGPATMAARSIGQKIRQWVSMLKEQLGQPESQMLLPPEYWSHLATVAYTV